MISNFIKFQPIHLIFVSTYRCTAACKNCCFDCKQDSSLPTLSKEKILHYIKEATSDFPSIKLAVFTGGECFLLGKDLEAAIGAAKSHGLVTRCVSNGYWATSNDTAHNILSEMKRAGLDELNLSTGDEHQQYVPVSNIVSGVVAACKLGIRTVLVIEGGSNSGFTLKSFIAINEISELLKSPFSKYLKIMTNVWIDFSRETAEQAQQKAILNSPEDPGCTNILESIIISPDERLLSCCGLTIKNIPEMDLGHIPTHGLKKLYDEQTGDFLKLWLRVEGPQGIMNQLSPASGEKFRHPCEACRALYSSENAGARLQEMYTAKVPDVVFKYKFKSLLQKPHDPQFLGNSKDGRQICYGV